jgi:KaiC/GvpD/RAD55 family RecA-like ATPase
MISQTRLTPEKTASDEIRFLKSSPQYTSMELPPLGVDKKLPILKKNKVSTGINDLDLIFEGGYPNPGNVMLIGPTGNEKAGLAFHFAASATKKENVIIISADSRPETIEKKAATMGLDLDKDNVYYIDCYSQTLGKGEAEMDERHLSVQGPGALNDISLSLRELITKSAGKKLRVVVFSLSTLVLYNPKDSIIKFLQVIEGRLKSNDATTLYLVEEGVHEKQLLSLMEHGMDQKIILNEIGGKFQLESSSIGLPIPIKLGPSGMSVV